MVLQGGSIKSMVGGGDLLARVAALQPYFGHRKKETRGSYLKRRNTPLGKRGIAA